MTKKQESWKAILNHCDLEFEQKVSSTFDSQDIKDATGGREPRIVCSMDSRSAVPPVLQNRNLFVLPVENGVYRLVKGPGYTDLPQITSGPTSWRDTIGFDLTTRHAGSGEDPYLLHAYNTGLLADFLNVEEIYQTTAGRRYSTQFEFCVADSRQFTVDGIQFQVDGLYEGPDEIVIVEAKEGARGDFLTRQLYYPYRHYRAEHDKEVRTIFYVHDEAERLHRFWEFEFEDINDYSSLTCTRSGKFRIDDPQRGLTEFR